MHSRPRTALRGGKRRKSRLGTGGASAHPLGGAQRASLSASCLCSMISRSSSRCSAPRSSSVMPPSPFVSKWLPRPCPRCRPRRSLRVSRWSARFASLGIRAPPVSSRGPASRPVLSSPRERLPVPLGSYRFTASTRCPARESSASSATAVTAAPTSGSAVNMPSTFTFEKLVMVSPFVEKCGVRADGKSRDLSGIGSSLVLESVSEQDRPTRLGKLSRALLLDARGHAIHADTHLGAEAFVARGHAVAEPGTRLAASRLVAALAGAGLAVRCAESIAAVLLDAELPGGVGIESAIVGSALAPTDLHAGIELMREIELLSGSRPTQQQRNRGAHARGSHAPIHVLLLVSPIVDPALPGHVAEDATRLLRGA